MENCKLYNPDYRVCKRGGGEWCALSSACGLPQLRGDGFSIIGLFIGLVILVLGYELLLDWLELDAGAAPGENTMIIDIAPDEEVDGG